MQEIQQQCLKLGIPLRTRHREVAPNQYEFAPMYGSVTTQIDQNIAVMQIIEEVAVKHGLTALLHEKPFQVGYSDRLLYCRLYYHILCCAGPKM